MTRDDLFCMMDGDKKKMEEAIDAVLASVKPAFVNECIRLEKERKQRLEEAIRA